MGPIGSAVLTFIGYKQTDKQTDKPNLYIDILYTTVKVPGQFMEQMQNVSSLNISKHILSARKLIITKLTKLQKLLKQNVSLSPTKLIKLQNLSHLKLINKNHDSKISNQWNVPKVVWNSVSRENSVNWEFSVLIPVLWDGD